MTSKQQHPARTHLRWLLLLFLVLLPAVRAATDPVSVMQQTIATEQAALEKLRADIGTLKQQHLKLLASGGTPTIGETDLAQARLALESAQVDAQSVQLDQISTRGQIAKLQARIDDLQHRKSLPPTAGDAGAAQDRQAANQEQKRLQSLLALQQRHLKLLGQRSSLLQQKVQLSEKWLTALQSVVEKRQAARRRESLADLEQKLQQQIQEKQAESSRLQEQLENINGNSPDDQARQVLLTQKIQFLNESINLLESRLKLAAEKAEMEGITTTGLEQTAPEKLKSWLDKIDSVQQQVTPAVTLTEGKLKVLRQQLALLEKRHRLGEIGDRDYRTGKQALRRLIDGFQGQLLAMQQLQQELTRKSAALNRAYKWNLSRSLTARQSLPTDPAVWHALLEEIGHLPATLLKSTTAIGRDLTSGWRNADLRDRAGFGLLALFCLGLVLALGRLPRPRPRPMAEDQTFTMKTREVFYALLRSSRPVILFGGPLLAAAWLFGVEARLLQLILLLVLVWLALQWLTRLSYWLFISPLVPSAQRQPRLHHTILWVIGSAALFTLLVGMGHAGLLSEPMRALVDRLFMLLLLPLVYLSLRLRALIIQRLRTESQGSFWPGLVALLSLAIPLTTLAAAAVGLAGYINLAWSLAGQLALVLVVLMAWLVLRHLMLDAMTRLRQLAGTRPDRAAFWLRGIIDPLQLLLRLALFLAAGWTLVLLLSWSTGTDIGSMLKNALDSPLFVIGKQTVTALHLVGAGLLAFSVVYLGIWSRRLTYDLIYRQIRDRGLRNSLSVFTQYMIIVIGLLLALNLLGIDLTSLTVFAGALGVGIGFGLQNIANNFISGLILLAERPVRTEDWVSIGDHDGRIKRIGMRSLVLTTWDNQDVIIPNAQLITNPVTNWTLSDSLVRTVFEVGVRYQDDPHQAQKVIEEAVSMQPAVSLERPPRILLTAFGDSSVNFRIEFFAVVERQSARLKIKSEVMFAIWDALQEAGIGIPFPQQDIYIKEMPVTPEARG